MALRSLLFLGLLLGLVGTLALAPLRADEMNGPGLTESPAPLPRASHMNKSWELDDETHSGRGKIRAFEPLLLIPLRYSNRPNRQPLTPSVEAVDAFAMDSVEVHFRVSLRTKLWDNPFRGNGDIWVAYTQNSYWQAYNWDESAPFRETNYMPEVFSVWRVGLPMGERWDWQMLSVGFKHQSNGRGSGLGISRSWNRLYARFGFEGPDTEIYVRPWVRVFSEEPDDNPDIKDFMGHGDLRVIRHLNDSRLDLTARLNPSTGKGMARLEYHFPLVGDLHVYLSIFSGYGESLLDYNHRQTTVSAGVSMFQF